MTQLPFTQFQERQTLICEQIKTLVTVADSVSLLNNSRRLIEPPGRDFPESISATLDAAQQKLQQLIKAVEVYQIDTPLKSE